MTPRSVPPLKDTPTYRFNRQFTLGVVVVMIILGVALAITLVKHPQNERPWRIAINSWPGFDNLYLAKHKGFFAANDLNIELVPINSITDMRTAFERGLIDGYTSTLMDATESLQESKAESRIVLVVDYSRGSDMVLAAPSVTTVADLNNAKVGIELSSALSRFMLGRMLEGSGLTEQNLRLIPGSQSVLSYQAIRGDLDAIITYQPYASEILEKRELHTLFDSNQIPEDIIDVLSVSPAMQQEEPELSRRLQLAWQSAIDYANSHPQETRELFASRYDVTLQQYQEMDHGVVLIDRPANQRMGRSGVLAEAMHRTAKVLNPEKPLSPALVSATLDIWYQKEGQR